MGKITRVDGTKVSCHVLNEDNRPALFCTESLKDADGNELVYAGYVPDVYMLKPEHAMLWVENRVKSLL